MPQLQLVKEHPCGDLLVRLKDVPLQQRLEAYARLMREGLTEDEAQELLALILDPGDGGGRVAA